MPAICAKDKSKAISGAQPGCLDRGARRHAADVHAKTLYKND